jgi:hypothetical protein
VIFLFRLRFWILLEFLFPRLYVCFFSCEWRDGEVRRRRSKQVFTVWWVTEFFVFFPFLSFGVHGDLLEDRTWDCVCKKFFVFLLPAVYCFFAVADDSLFFHSFVFAVHNKEGRRQNLQRWVVSSTLVASPLAATVQFEDVWCLTKIIVFRLFISLSSASWIRRRQEKLTRSLFVVDR